MNNTFEIFNIKSINLKNELFAGLTVAMTMIPESLSFAILAGLPPLTGLYAAFLMGLITSVLGGRPGMVSGGAGATVIVLMALAARHGIDYLFAAVVFAGLLQFLVGLFKWGKFVRLIPQPVMYGFLNGLAIIIFMAQVVQFKVNTGQGAEWMSGSTLYIMGGLTLLTMLIVIGFPRITKAVPASLIAILVVFGLVSLLGIDTKKVVDIASVSGTLPHLHLPNVPLSWETLQFIFPYSLVMAGVGLVESLLTLNMVDEITASKGNANRESMAQGIANTINGFFGGMGGCAMVGVMMMVAIGTFQWVSLRIVNKFPKSDIFVGIIVAGITVVLHNLALAVLIGVVVSALVFAWDNAKRIRARKYLDAEGIKHYEIYGPLFFGSTANFLDKFDVLEDPERVILDFKESRVVDMSAVDALNKITERYAAQGKKIELWHLREDCRSLLKNAAGIVKVNIMEDPTYRVMPGK